MNMIDLIEKKRDGESLSKEEIYYIVSKYTDGSIPDYQMSAFLMAVVLNGMDENETYDLTYSMRHSGNILDLSDIPGVIVDKHSTGGVGDKVTLVLAPLVAAAGVPVAKMSGRGLGHTGGTIDKLECIPGFRTSLTEEEFISNVKNHGIAISGQTGDLAPADKKIYALRDATATVRSMPLIASSIMSKKLAAGAGAIVLDIKTGSGAFMKTLSEAKALANEMKALGERAGRRVTCVISSMDEPLGLAIGNSMEVTEAVFALRGNGPDDLMEVVYTLAEQMLLLAGRFDDRDEAGSYLRELIASNKAWEKFLEFVKLQGGDVSVFEEGLPAAKKIYSITADRDGVVSSIDAGALGHACMMIGGGREKKDDVIDPEVGILLSKKVGDDVVAGDVLAQIFFNDDTNLYDAADLVTSAYTIGEFGSKPKLILDIL